MREQSQKDKKSEKLASAVQKTGITSGGLRLLKTAGFSVVLVALALVFYYLLEIPWPVGAAMVLVALFIVLVEVIRIVRMSKAALRPPDQAPPPDIGPDPDEVLAEAIPAVLEYGKTRSVEVLGAGRILTPENALLITNKAVWALTVPLAGADKVISGADIGKWQWMYAYSDIVSGLRQMIAALPLKEVLAQGRAKRLLRLDEIREVKAPPLTYAISLTRLDGKTFGYSIRLEQDYLRAKAFFGLR